MSKLCTWSIKEQIRSTKNDSIIRLVNTYNALKNRFTMCQHYWKSYDEIDEYQWTLFSTNNRWHFIIEFNCFQECFRHWSKQENYFARRMNISSSVIKWWFWAISYIIKMQNIMQKFTMYRRINIWRLDCKRFILSFIHVNIYYNYKLCMYMIFLSNFRPIKNKGL